MKSIVERREHILISCSIHAHYQTKYFFTGSLHNTYSLHGSSTAPWLHQENRNDDCDPKYLNSLDKTRSQI